MTKYKIWRYRYRNVGGVQCAAHSVIDIGGVQCDGHSVIDIGDVQCDGHSVIVIVIDVVDSGRGYPLLQVDIMMEVIYTYE